MINTWIIKGYKGFDDCDGVCDYNLDYELDVDDKINKEEIELL